MWPRIVIIGLMLVTLFVSRAWAEKAEYNEQILQNAATANGAGAPMAVDRYSSLAVDVTITGTATVNFEGSVTGTVATAVTCTLTSTGAATQTATATGMYQCNVAGLKAFQARISGYSSGSVTVYARATTAILGRGGAGGGGGGVTSVDATGGVQTTTGSPITTTGTIRQATLVNAQTGTTYTIDTTDRGKLVTFSNASPVAVTLPVAGGSFPAGWVVDMQNRGAGTVTITPTTSTIDGGASVALGTNSGIRVMSDGSNYFTQRGTGGSGGAPIDAGYITDRANASLSNEINLGALATGALIGTVSGGVSTISAYAGVTCTNQVLRILSASLAGTCNTITSAFVDTSVWTGTATSGLLKATSQGVLTSATAGTDYASPSTVNTWGDGVKQTFNPDGTNAGINVGSHTVDPSTPVNGDIFYDSGTTTFNFYENDTWKNLGVQSEVDTLQTVFARGDTLSTNESTQFKIRGTGGQASNGANLYQHSNGTFQWVCVVAGVENDCNYIRKLASGKTWSLQNSSGVDKFTFTESTGALTNITIDAEATGNTITIPEERHFAVASCQNVTPSANFDLPTTNAPSPLCDTGSNTQKAYLAFDATTDESFQDHFILPTGFTGAIDVHFRWKAAATTGSVGWCAQLVRVADGSTSDPAYPAQASGNCVSDTAKGTTLQENSATKTGVTCTSCAAGDHVYIRISRDADGGAVTDDMTGDALLLNYGRTIRVAN